MKKPIYRSFVESFRLNLYLPACGLITPPTATYRADANLARVMASSRPPQAVMMHLNGNLQLLSPAGEKSGISMKACGDPRQGRAHSLSGIGCGI
ncbi:MAG: hypothetical protein PUE61_04515 [Clostridiales bacterium]|nr:hypothetical protein [Clostridiales bacterium]